MSTFASRQLTRLMHSRLLNFRRLRLRLLRAACVGLVAAAGSGVSAQADDVRFERIQLSREFHSEGGTTADLDADGHGDVVVGPWIYWGPTFEQKSKFYAGEAMDPAGYSANFLMYSDDIDGDKSIDTVVLGFPGMESWWYRNPGKESARKDLWEKFTILDVVDNESPTLADLDGDGVKDLVCSSKGRYGYASHAGQDPKAMWKFTAISPNNNYHRYTHGLGVGDVNNDQRMDLLEKDGWWENPGPRTGDDAEAPWKFHKIALASPGGSQMYAVDLDGDGKNELLTGLSAHGFGLVYYKVQDAAAGKFEKIEIMTADAATSPVGIAVSQLHAVDLGDINGDGIPDVVTGKRWWAHAAGDDGSHMPASLVWLETQRGEGRLRFVPHVIDNSSGVGTQIMVADVNGDKRLDVVAGTKRGAYLFLQVPADWPSDRRYVTADPFEQRPATESLAIEDDLGGYRPALGSKQPLNFDFESGQSNDWEVRGSIAKSAIVESESSTGAHGKFMATSASASKEKDKPVGELISRPFKLTHAWLSGLVSGGKDPKACVEVVSESSGQVIGRFPGTEGDALQRQWLDLKDQLGSIVRIRLVDHLPNGHISLDDIRLHAEKK